MKRWLNYFEHNRIHRAHISWHQPLNIEPHLLRPLIRSLQRFQIGESGEGRHLRAAAAILSSAPNHNVTAAVLACASLT